MVVPFLCVAGCGDNAQDIALRTEISTLGGVPVVVNRGEPAVWALEEALTLGGADAIDDAQLFGQVSDVVADARGDIYVADQIRRGVYVFSPSGRFLRTIGREGAGPAEYQLPRSIALLGDTLAVFDFLNARVGLFTLDGGWIGQWPLGTASGAFTQTGPGEVWAYTIRRAEAGIERIFVRYLHNGPVDTVPARPDPDRDMMEPENGMDCVAGDAIYIIAARYDPVIVRAPASGGRVVESDPVGYRLVFSSARGDTVRIVEYDTPDTMMNDSIWDIERARLDSLHAAAQGARCPRGVQRPTRRQLVGEIIVDDVGRMWINRRRSNRIDVFGPDGRLLGQLRDPDHPTATLRFVRNGQAYFVTTDTMDVETVRVYRVRQPDT